MASSKRAQDDKNLKIIREIAALPANKQCIDCGQRGPTYVNMTIGAFVCTACSGRLRGLNPPHRVKSISMTSFTQAEIDHLKKSGNELAKAKWLGRWSERSDKEPDFKDEQAAMDFMREKYERKRWYVEDPSPKDTQQDSKSIPLGKPPQREKKGLSGSPSIGSVRQRPQSTTPTQSSTSTPTATKPVESTDTIVDVDPFGPSEPVQNPSKKPVGGVAVLPGVAAVLKPAASKSPSDDSFTAFTSAQTVGANTLVSANQSTGSISSTGSGLQPNTGMGDKYAALGDLDAVLRDMKVKDEVPSQPPPPQPQTQNQIVTAPTSNPFGSGAPVQNGPGWMGPGINPSNANPFGSQNQPGAVNPFASPVGGQSWGGQQVPVNQPVTGLQGFPGQQQGFMAQQQGFQPQQQRFAGQQQGFMTQQQGFQPQQGFTGQPQGFTSQQQGFTGQQQGFTSQQQGFTGQQQGFTGQQQGFTGQQQGFQSQQQRFPGQQQGFTGQQQGFTGQQQGFQPQQQGFPGQQQGFATQQQSFPSLQSSSAGNAPFGQKSNVWNVSSSSQITSSQPQAFTGLGQLGGNQNTMFGSGTSSSGVLGSTQQNNFQSSWSPNKQSTSVTMTTASSSNTSSMGWSSVLKTPVVTSSAPVTTTLGGWSTDVLTVPTPLSGSTMPTQQTGLFGQSGSSGQTWGSGTSGWSNPAGGTGWSSTPGMGSAQVTQGFQQTGNVQQGWGQSSSSVMNPFGGQPQQQQNKSTNPFL